MERELDGRTVMAKRRKGKEGKGKRSGAVFIRRLAAGWLAIPILRDCG